MASIALVQLEKLARANLRRRELVAQYCRLLADVGEVELPPQDDATYQSAWHLFHIKCEKRDDLSQFLASRGIATSVHYMPLHTYDCYPDHPHLPNAESLQYRLLTLPLYPDLTEADVGFVCEMIRLFYATGSRYHRDSGSDDLGTETASERCESSYA